MDDNEKNMNFVVPNQLGFRTILEQATGQQIRDSDIISKDVRLMDLNLYGSSKWTLTEWRLVSIFYSKINPLSPPTKQNPVLIPVEEYRKYFGIESQKSVIRTFNRISRSDYGGTLIDVDNEVFRGVISFFKMVGYIKETKMISLVHNDVLDENLFNLGQYISYKMGYTKYFKKTASFGFQDYLLRALAGKEQAIIEIDVEAIKGAMRITGKYPTFRSLNQKQLSPVLEELNKYSALSVKILDRKRESSKKVRSVVFDVRLKSQMKEDRIRSKEGYLKRALLDAQSSLRDFFSDEEIELMNEKHGSEFVQAKWSYTLAHCKNNYKGYMEKILQGEKSKENPRRNKFHNEMRDEHGMSERELEDLLVKNK